MRFKINRASGGQPWYFRIVAGNGQTLATSETYYNWSDAYSAALSIKQNAGSAPIE